MAEILGESGAYKGVRSALARVGLSITSLDEIAGIRASLEADQGSLSVQAEAEFDAETARRQAVLAKAEDELRLAYAHAELLFHDEWEAARGSLANLRAEGELLGPFWRNLFPPGRLFVWLGTSWRTAAAHRKLSSIQSHWERSCRILARPAQARHSELQAHLGDRVRFIAARVRGDGERLACVTRLIDEGEVGGAAGELEVIGELSQLPSGWIVLNDVKLVADRWYRFDGQHLKTAQLDHVVVGPGGIFVIETKNWSRDFVEKGGFFSPYQQVARASYLCHKILAQRGAASRTRAIIATRSRLPDKPKESHAKILRPTELCGYLRWFEESLSVDDVSRATKVLARFMESG